MANKEPRLDGVVSLQARPPKRGARAWAPVTTSKINVVLVGFNGNGGYHYKLDSHAMHALLQSRFPTCTPSFVQTGRSTFVEHHLTCNVIQALLTYNVIQAPDDAVTMLETALRGKMKEAREEQDMQPVTEASKADGGRSKVFEVEASEVEFAFDKVYHAVFSEQRGSEDSLHPDATPLSTNDSAIIIVNFDKLRLDPRNPNPAELEGGSLTESWDSGDLTPEQLKLQEGNYIYRYKYLDVGTSMTWIAKERYVVIDVSSGPVSFGPIGADARAVTSLSVPRLQAVLKRSAESVDMQPPGALRAQALKEAIVNRDTVFRGELASLIFSAVTHLIIPDVRGSVATVEEGRRLLMPVISLRDHEDFDPVGDGTSDPELSDLWGARRLVDLEAVREVAESSLRGRRKLVMPVGSLMLHEHKALATAIAKATRTASGAGESG
eukprot:CAMPEP_0177794032 /NCGR_PEP_ID=MMETSP0491_2-20121128/25414_1 /TAXON_ID=63592 /ORGANISM="Tetraselmis chuii, Strain PLY429" /LENGTH=437 /DNA_ID=CAMNT_0019316631 /DNA_START=313 /DNA_END=1623 /DNA_ORIENTATION=-